MRARRNRYVDVMLTYAQRPVFRWLVLLICAWGVLCYWWFSVNTLVNWPWRQRGYSMRFSFATTVLVEGLVGIGPLFLIVALVAALMSHLKEQLRDWRAVLTPRYLAPHLIIGAVFFAMVACAGSWGLYQSIAEDPWPYLPGVGRDTGVSLLGAIAVTLALMTLAAWWSSFRSAWPSLLIVPLCLLLMTSQSALIILKAFLLVDAGRVETAIRIGLLLADIGGLYLLARSLCRPGGLAEPFDTAGIRRRSTWNSGEPRREHVACVGFWSRAAHRRQAVLGRGTPWIMAAALGGLLFGVSLLYVGQSQSHHIKWEFGERPSDLTASLLLAAIVPAVAVAIIWRERWATFGYESLFPASRAEFAAELAAAMALDLLEFWAATTIAALIPALIWAPGILLDPLILASLLASAIIQLLNFGAILFAAQSPALMGLIVTLSALLLAAAIPMSMAFHERPALNPSQLIITAIIEGTGGLVLGLAGIQGWRRRELV
ncbi:MAG TPA: hypothetical protein VH370_18720 [Humisphaera sp.]|jgi:hypothetical protein|nr:hypothetical protein [Humisphaera sp.]